MQYVISPGTTVGAGSVRSFVAQCPTGKKVLGGGASTTLDLFARVALSAPTDPGTGWVVAVRNVPLRSDDTTALTAFAWAVCANVS